MDGRWVSGRLRSGSAGGQLLCELEGAGAADDAKTLISRARPRGVFELSFNVVAVAFTLMSKDATSVFPRGDDAVGGELGTAVIGDGAIDCEVTGLAGGASLSVKAAALDDADKFPSVSFGISFWRAGEFRKPVSVVALSPKRGGR